MEREATAALYCMNLFHSSNHVKPGLVLSFRADGPYWSDLVQLLAYPKGVSYIWPFRYGRNRIASDLCTEIENPKSRRALSGQRVLIAARFQDPNATQTLLPIREGAIISVDPWTGTYSFNFRLGDTFQFQQASDLASCTTQTQQSVEILAFREEVERVLKITTSDELVGIAWKSFVHLVANEKKLPISEDAARSLFIHIGAPMDDGAFAAIGRIHKSSSGNDVYGHKLSEGKKYEVKYSHYVPYLERHNTTVREITVRPLFSDKTVQFTEAEGTLIGNYGTQSLMIAAVSPTAVWHSLAIAPVEKKLVSQKSNIEINTHRFQIPVAIKWSFWYWIRHKLLPTAILFLALVTLGIANTIDKNLSKLLDGSLKWNQLFGSSLLIGIVIVCSAAASIAVPILQSRNKPG